MESLNASTKMLVHTAMNAKPNTDFKKLTNAIKDNAFDPGLAEALEMIGHIYKGYTGTLKN